MAFSNPGGSAARRSAWRCSYVRHFAVRIALTGNRTGLFALREALWKPPEMALYTFILPPGQ